MPDARSPIRHYLVLYRRDPEQGRGVRRPLDAHEPHEGHDVLAVGALGVRRLAALNPHLEDTGYGKEKLLDALAHFGGVLAGEDWRQLQFKLSFCSELGHGFR